MRLAGPLAAWELRRLGRSGALARGRVGLVLALLLGLAVAYYGSVGGPSAGVTIAQASRVAENYLYATLAVTALAVVVLTPVVAAGAISEEKERGRLDFLRSTMLGPREIVLGKYAARVLHVFAVLAAAVPVLALSMLFGGVDVELLAAAALTTVTGVLWVAAYGLWLSIKRANLREAAVVAYANLTALTAAGLCCGCVPGVSGLSPLSTTAYLIGLREATWFWLNTCFIAVCQLGMTAALLKASVKDFANLAGEKAAAAEPPPVPPVPLPPAHARGEQYVLDRLLVTASDPVDEADPLGWKERHFAPRYAAGVGEATRGFFNVLAAAVAAVVAVVVFAAVANAAGFARNDRVLGVNPVGDTLRGLTAAGGGLLMVLLATRAATSVAGEAERGTLAPLLVLPWERLDILRPKARAGLGWLGWSVGGAALLEIFSVAPVFAIDVGVAAAVAAALLAVAQVAAAGLLAAAVGLWFSVTCATSTRAAIWSLVTLLAVAVVPLLLTPLATGPLGRAAVAAFSPPAGVWLTHDYPAVGVLPLAAESLAAWLLWRSTRRRFEAFGR